MLHLVFAVMWVMIIIVGVIGNSLVIYVVARFAKMQVREPALGTFDALFRFNVCFCRL